MGNDISAVSLLASSLALQTAGAKIGIEVMKKTNDIARQEGQEIIAMLQESTSQLNEHMLDVYA